MAEPFSADLLDGGTFRLSEHMDQIVVLDFWATWCGHCIRAMPRLIEAVGQFSEDQVLLVAVNQKENAETITRFLETRGWDLTVALDPEGKVGRRFNVRALPQTVIIGPGGKIERLHAGSHPDFAGELSRTVRELSGEH
jgi:thiol-disulfide isomerase/thioredoxin